MKIVKWLAGALLLLALVLVAGGWLLSPRFTVSRSTVVAAPAERVFALVADPREWKQWSAWNRRDPAMEIGYSGPASGAGASWAWKSKSQGDGSMTFTNAEPGQAIGFDLYFPDFGSTSHGRIVLTPEGAGTRVTWTMNGDMGRNPLYHWFALFADGMVGEDFEAGLANLKQVAEQRP